MEELDQLLTMEQSTRAVETTPERGAKYDQPPPYTHTYVSTRVQSGKNGRRLYLSTGHSTLDQHLMHCIQSDSLVDVPLAGHLSNDIANADDLGEITWFGTNGHDGMSESRLS